VSLTRLLGIARQCRDLDETARFYCEGCGFTEGDAAAPDDLLMPLLRPAAWALSERHWLWRGDQPLLLVHAPADARPAPDPLPGCNLAFQHIALVTRDIGTDHARCLAHGARPLGALKPQKLPPESGGVTAFKAGDPEGHPFELLAFPPGRDTPATRGGIDHSALSVRDGAANVAYYTDLLGLDCSGHQINRGPEQERLDGLDAVQVKVITLHPAGHPAPHVELLAYQHPAPISADVPLQPGDIAADHLLFLASGLDRLATALEQHGHPPHAHIGDPAAPIGIATRDPDGHHLVILADD